MLSTLYQNISKLPKLLEMPEIWNSLIVNRRKPHTYRIFTQSPLDERNRICLHKFDPCSTEESFKHPHPWKGAFTILSGGYHMWTGFSPSKTTQPIEVAQFELHEGSTYEIINPLTWHSVTPLTTTYTVMVNEPPFDKEIAHTECRTTKGKDLDTMNDVELFTQLELFKILVNKWLKNYG